MRRNSSVLFALLLVCGFVLAGTATAQSAAAKVNICHFTGKNYVAVTVSQSAAAKHIAHHQDILGAPVPQGTTRQKKAAARTFCAALPVLSPTRGGKQMAATLTSTTAGLTGSVKVRARLGQGQLCLSLQVSSTTTPITVSAINVLNGATNVATLNLSTLGSLTSPTSPLSVNGCVNVDRNVIKQILQTSGLTFRVTTSGGTLNGTLG